MTLMQYFGLWLCTFWLWLVISAAVYQHMYLRHGTHRARAETIAALAGVSGFFSTGVLFLVLWLLQTGGVQ